MRKPSARGRPIDRRRIESWLDRFEGYRVTVNCGRVGEWFSNFRVQDKDLGARVLDAVTFLRSQDMEAALRDTVGHLPGWHRSEVHRRGKWRFVAFSISAGESGDSMLHRCRTALGLTASRYDALFIHKSDLIREKLGADDNVAFIDDFAGSGAQACRAWLGDPETRITGLSELLPGSPKTYLVLVAAGERAVDRIARETHLEVAARHVLGSGDDVFSDDCRHFTQAEKNVLLSYCQKASRRYPRGFGDCGFVIVLAHKTPNNSIAILHVNNKRWRGLFPRG